MSHFCGVYRRLSRGWRHYLRRSGSSKVIGLLCVTCLLFLSVSSPISPWSRSGNFLREEEALLNNIHLRQRPVFSPSRTTQVFRIKEVKGQTLTYYDMPTQARRYLEREKRVTDMCRGREKELLGLSSEKWAYERIEINKDIHTVYCPLLKVGSTFWRRVFHAIRKNQTIRTPYDVSINSALSSKRQTLSELLPLNQTSTQDFLKKSVNIMFVREPFSRLLSGYIDKLFAPNPYFWSAVGRFIIKHYRKNPSERSLNCGHDVTFPEFVKYVIDTEGNNRPQRDAHFTPTYDQCKPCEIRYNAIGKMETFKEDTAFIFHTLGYNVSVNSLKLWAAKAEEDAVIDSTFSPFSWKKPIKRCMSFYEAAKRIWHKMQIRGIVRKDVKMFFSEHDMRSVSPRRFAQAMMEGRGSPPDRMFLKKQKHEALQKAFQLVPSEDVEKIRKLFMPDFQLFGYDLYPEHIFPDSSAGTSENSWVFDLSTV